MCSALDVGMSNLAEAILSGPYTRFPSALLFFSKQSTWGQQKHCFCLSCNMRLLLVHTGHARGCLQGFIYAHRLASLWACLFSTRETRESALPLQEAPPIYADKRSRWQV